MAEGAVRAAAGRHDVEIGIQQTPLGVGYQSFENRVIGMIALGAEAKYLPLTRMIDGHAHSLFLVKESGDRRSQSFGQSRQHLKTGCDTPGLDLRQHAFRAANRASDGSECQFMQAPCMAQPLAQGFVADTCFADLVQI